MPLEETKGESLFRRYLDQHGYEYDRPDHDDRNVKAADFRIKCGGEALAVAELKQFETFREPWPEAGQTRMLNRKDVYGPVREKVREASKNLKAHRHEGLPLVVVLTNPFSLSIPLDEQHVLHALFGSPAFRFKVIPDEERLGEPEPVFGGDGRLKLTDGDRDGQHVYISAVAVVRQANYQADFLDRYWAARPDSRPPQSIREAAERTPARMAESRKALETAGVPDETYLAVDVFENVTVPAGEAVPLPPHIFDAPGDRRLGFVPGSGGYEVETVKERNLDGVLAGFDGP